MTEREVVVYAQPGCGACHQKIGFLSQNDITFFSEGHRFASIRKGNRISGTPPSAWATTLNRSSL